MRTAQIPPDEAQRSNAILSDYAVQPFLAGEFTNTDTFRQVLIDAILKADPLTHYVRGVESWQDYLQQRSKHFPMRGIR
jgi:hypothetical protein